MRKILKISVTVFILACMFAMTVCASTGDEDRATEVDGIAINSVNFPDAVFRTCVTAYDTNGDDALSEEELVAVTAIEYGPDNYRDSIADLTGIQYFTELEILDVVATDTMTTLDLSANTKLRELEILGTSASRAEALTSIDLSANVNLQVLSISRTGITSLDLTNNTEIYYLYLSYNSYLSSLNISTLSKLEELYVFETMLEVLDLRGCTSLIYIESGYSDPTSGFPDPILIWSDSDDTTTDDTTSDETLSLEREEVFTDGILEYEIGAIAGVSKLTVTSDEATLVFDEKALESIINTMLDAVEEDLYFQNFSIIAEAVDATTLDESIQELVGTRPVFDFSIWAEDIEGNRMQITDFGNGSVTITIAYELAEGESADGLLIYYIDSDTVETIAIDSYDSENGLISFTTTHFSTYAVGYDENAEAGVDDTTEAGVDDTTEAGADDTVEDGTDDTAEDGTDDTTEAVETSDATEAVETSDASHVLFYALLLVVAGCGVVIFERRRRVI